MRSKAFRRRISQLIIMTLLAASLMPAFAQEGPFSKGTLRFSGGASASTGFGGNSFQLGLGTGYYVMDGLELGLDARSWFGGNYSVHEIEPSVTYVFTQFDRFTPYGGVLYRRTFLENRDDLSAYGGRLGILLQQSHNIYVRAGVTGIRHHDCDRTIQSDCSDFYPEVSVGLYF
jgi:hypothetical protein